MTAEGKFKTAPSPRGALVGSALPNLNIKHYSHLSNFQNVKTPAQM